MIKKHVSEPTPDHQCSNDGQCADESLTDWKAPVLIARRFSVPYLHRIWFCDGAFEDACPDDRPIIEHTLQTDGQETRVQIWVDSGADDANPAFAAAIKTSIDQTDNLVLTRPVQRITGGESCKNDPAVIDAILTAINDDHLDRRSYIVVIGGGAVLDAVGYAAAIAHRGIRLVRFPSTTLAQSDSGVGVKNAVNTFGKKNWKGTFSVPWAVVNDYALLRSLPQKTFASGFSEAVKVALLKSAETFQYICTHADEIASGADHVCQHTIAKSAKLHLNHITDGGDPFEVLEARPLDFGHWSAHKLESISRYSIRHGDAVAIGLAIDTLYSVSQLNLDPEVAIRIVKCLVDLKLPISHELLKTHAAEIIGGLEEFRQHLGGRLTVTMLRAVGQPVDVHTIDHATMHRVFELLAATTDPAQSSPPYGFDIGELRQRLTDSQT